MSDGGATEVAAPSPTGGGAAGGTVLGGAPAGGTLLGGAAAGGTVLGGAPAGGALLAGESAVGVAAVSLMMDAFAVQGPLYRGRLSHSANDVVQRICERAEYTTTPALSVAYLLPVVS